MRKVSISDLSSLAFETPELHLRSVRKESRSDAAGKNLVVEYTISDDSGCDVCLVVLTGDVGAQSSITMLDSVWQNETYLKARYVIWDLEHCGSFPDFNEFVLIANHARKNKPKDGPSRIAFCSATFENSMLVKVLKGFTRALPQKVRYVTTHDEALEWFATYESDAA